MSAWIVVPCLLTLRDEFNTVSPKRDKGSDGTIGDSAHTSASDHSADEDSSVLAGKDADKVNEVHALDIDSSGPWPSPGWFDRTIANLIEREKAEYESATVLGRLQNVIWNGYIYSRSWGWTKHKYDGADQHTGHAHLSARYLSATESDTRPWGVSKSIEGDDVSSRDVIEALESAAGKNAIWDATFGQDRFQGYTADGTAIPEVPGDAAANDITGASALTLATKYGKMTEAQVRALAGDVALISAKLDALSAQVAGVDEATAETLFGGTNEQIKDLLATALGARASEIAELLLADK